MSASRSLDDGSLTPASAAAADTLEMTSAAQENASDVPMVPVDKPLLGGDDDDDGTVSLEEGRKQQQEEQKRGTNNSRSGAQSTAQHARWRQSLRWTNHAAAGAAATVAACRPTGRPLLSLDCR